MTVVDRLNARVSEFQVIRSGLFGIYEIKAPNGARWWQEDGPPLGIGPCTQMWRIYWVESPVGVLQRFPDTVDSYITSLEAFEHAALAG